MRFRPTEAVVDLDAVRHNARTIKPAGAELMAVVKADAYGHGDVPVARAAIDGGATWLGVAQVEEGLRLREAGLEAPILTLTEFPADSEKEALAARLTPTVYTSSGVARVAEAAKSLDRSIGVHVKIDTGMHRVGLAPDRAPALVREVLDAGLELDGLWTHFAKADEPEDPITREQLRRFLEVTERLGAQRIRPRLRHAANSAGVMTIPMSHLDLVRVGVALYGIEPAPGLAEGIDLRPAMSLRSAVSLVKRVPAGDAISYGLRYRLEGDATIATVPIGYADGYARGLSEQGAVLIGGKRYPVAGAVTMDHITVDCGDDPVEPGDEVVLFGRQGDDEITANELASWHGTIGYEVVCAVSKRVPRDYVGELEGIARQERGGGS
ncbi:MAG: alanine racemase [Actinomycetota bacterium]